MSAVEISVVCPFYNEEDLLERAARSLLAHLESLGSSFELILVNDGSTDRSAEIAARLAAADPRLRLLGYPENRGRGFALRTGIAAARGEIIVTTEMDSSWGEHIVHDLVRCLRENRMFHIAVASPHLPGGGYRNIPRHRVWLSRLGNLFIRLFLPGSVTMNTGMTRAYRRHVLRCMPLAQDGKLFHLEVIAKAHALGFAIVEIPATLEWPDPQRALRKNPVSLLRHSWQHAWYVFRLNPASFFFGLGAAALLLALSTLVIGGAWDARHPFDLPDARTPLLLLELGAGLLLLGVPFWILGRLERRRWRRASAALQASDTANGA